MNIYEKLLEIRKSVTGLKKSARNEHYNYDYTPSSEVIGAVRDKMNELGVLLIPEVTQTVVHTGGKQLLTEMWLQYTWINSEDPQDHLKCPWYAQGVDSGERGPGKAYTYGEKYFIKKFFNIPDDADDPDAHKNEYTEKPTVKTTTVTPPKSSPVHSYKKELIDQLGKDGYDLNYVGMFLNEKEMIESDQHGVPNLSTLSEDAARKIKQGYSDFTDAFQDWAGKLAKAEE